MKLSTADPGVCACLHLRRATRAVTRLYDLVLAPTGLKATQFIALMEIGHAEEIPQYQLAQEYSVAVATLSRRLAALRRKGLITVRLGPRQDRIYSLTEEGRKKLEASCPYWERAQTRLKTVLGTDDWDVFLRVTSAVTTAALKAIELRTTNSAPRVSDQQGGLNRRDDNIA
jgi:DNA-binding MarR family transcriptional regulator